MFFIIAPLIITNHIWYICYAIYTVVESNYVHLLKYCTEVEY